MGFSLRAGKSMLHYKFKIWGGYFIIIVLLKKQNVLFKTGHEVNSRCCSDLLTSTEKWAGFSSLLECVGQIFECLGLTLSRWKPVTTSVSTAEESIWQAPEGRNSLLKSICIHSCECGRRVSGLQTVKHIQFTFIHIKEQYKSIRHALSDIFYCYLHQSFPMTDTL